MCRTFVQITYTNRMRNLPQIQTNLDKYTCFYLQRHNVSNMQNCAERHFLHSRLHENSNNLKQIFRIRDSLLGWGKDLPLPPGFSNQELANNINSFFITKTANIRNQLETSIANIGPLTSELVRTTSTLNTF